MKFQYIGDAAIEPPAVNYFGVDFILNGDAVEVNGPLSLVDKLRKNPCFKTVEDNMVVVEENEDGVFEEKPKKKIGRPKKAK